MKSRALVTGRFNRRIDKTLGHGPHGTCWIWTGGKNKNGYGVLKTLSGTLAHRIAWELHNGSIPDGLCVLHRCDNPPCVNPDHLFLGTKADNMRDMAIKGRSGKGHNPKLSADKVRAIRRRHAAGENRQCLAAEYGVTKWQITRVVSCKRWAHVL